VIVAAAKAVRLEAEIARRGGLGLKRVGSELVGPCVRCGGDDRFAINMAKQLWHCRACAAGGDIVDLIQHIDGVDFRTAVRTLAGFETAPPKSETPKLEGQNRPIELTNQNEIDSENTARALRIWDHAKPITGTIAERYLHSRGLRDLPSDVLRFHPSCPFGKTRHPSLLSRYTDIATNEPRVISRTALSAAGNKVGRMSLGPVGGAAIKIDDDANVEYGLAIGEGLETVLAARRLGFRPAWALGSAGAIRNFPALPGIEALTILVDHDEPDQRGRQAGQEAAAAYWHRWNDADRQVRAFSTDKAGADIADIVKRAHHG